MFSNPNKGLEQNSRTDCEIALRAEKHVGQGVDPHEAQSGSKVGMSM